MNGTGKASWVSRFGLLAALLAMGPIVSAQPQPAGLPPVDETLAPYVSTADSVKLPDGRMLHIVCMGKGSPTVILSAGLGDQAMTWNAIQPAMARITRSVALAVRKQDYINAAVARGETGLYVVTREMLPNVIAPVIVETTIRVSFAIMLFATLSFLGLGAQPPAQEWGLMVAQARQYMHQSAWMLIWPSAAIAIVAIGFNLLGDGLRDVLNPRL